MYDVLNFEGFSIDLNQFRASHVNVMGCYYQILASSDKYFAIIDCYVNTIIQFLKLCF